MSEPSFKDQFLSPFTRRFTNSKFRPRQLWQQIWHNQSTVSGDATQESALIFLEKYHCLLFPEQTFCQPGEESTIDFLKLRTAELILKQVNLYYLPHRLESLLPYCDPFTAVATFLNALNLSYEMLIQDAEQQKLSQAFIKELMNIEQDYDLRSTAINDFPLYESASTHNLENFQNTAFAFKRALDIIHILDNIKPHNYQKQKDNLLRFWHQQKIQKLEKIIKQLTQ